MSVDFVELDASSGGQIFRYGIGLSALLGKPVRIKNIRKQASNPGLQSQHLTALTALSKICSAEVKGAKQHSLSVEFVPKEIRASNFSVNIGTAGSVSLFIQALLFPSLKESQKISVIGGTDVPWAPSYYFFQEELFPVLSRMGARFECGLGQHGFFPKGRGKVFFSSRKARLPLKPVFFGEQGNLSHIKIFSQSSNLPKEVSVNQALACRKELEHLGADIVEKIYFREESSTIGSAIDAFAFFDSGAILSANALGAKAKPALDVGREAAKKLLEEISSKMPVDMHLADQLIPFIALADGYSTIRVSKFTEHCREAISVTEKFLPAKFEVKGSLDNPTEVFVEGTGWKN